MPRTVDDIMTKELLSVPPDLPAPEAAALLRSFGVGAAPILDEGRRPLGVVSLRDRLDLDLSVGQVMSRPADCVSIGSTIEDAAERMARGDRHHLVVVDSAGTAVGMLSTLDVLRALIDAPARHPAPFPGQDPLSGISWTDDWPLDPESCKHAPDGPGVLLLVASRRAEREDVHWVEALTDVRARLLAYASEPMHQAPALTRVLALRGLRFRAARIEDPTARYALVARLQSNLDHRLPRGAA